MLIELISDYRSRLASLKSPIRRNFLRKTINISLAWIFAADHSQALVRACRLWLCARSLFICLSSGVTVNSYSVSILRAPTVTW